MTVVKPELNHGQWKTSQLGTEIFGSDAECALLFHPLKLSKFDFTEDDMQLKDEIVRATPRFWFQI